MINKPHLFILLSECYANERIPHEKHAALAELIAGDGAGLTDAELHTLRGDALMLVQQFDQMQRENDASDREAFFGLLN
jgi:hypothetical protein